MEEAEGALSLGAVGTSKVVCSEKNEAHKQRGGYILNLTKKYLSSNGEHWPGICQVCISELSLSSYCED